MSMLKQSNTPVGVGPAYDTWYAFGSDQMSYLEGKLLIVLDASISDQEQRKALKDILRQTLWSWALHETCRVEYEDVKFREGMVGGIKYSKLSERK